MKTTHWIACALGAAALAACGEDSGASSPEGATSGTEPLYAMMIQVYGTDDRTVYVHLTKSLDLDAEIDLSEAREFPGVANFAGVGGQLLVSSGTDPLITEFEISDDLKWTDGSTVSFASYPLEDNANFYYQYILDDQTAYMPFEVTKRLIWNPTAMTLGEVHDDTNLVLETEDNLQLRVGGNRNGIRFDGPVQQAFYHSDEDWHRFGDESYVAIYDPETHEERDIVTLPCPGLSMASQDEDGYTYYGSWDYVGTLALFGEGPAPCVARLTPDLELDESWTTDFTDLTDGRYVTNFRYVGDGRAVGNVLHHELLDADFDGGYDAEVGDFIWTSGDHWKFWMFDLDAWEAAPVDGIDVAVGSGAQFAVLDGRTFVFLPYDDWGRTKIYELDAEGRAVERSDTLGDVFKWIRVR